ncbi:MAG: NTP-binding protein [Polycyclovorans sp.]|nr:NTP-binding protein [Polycyclovorans sp.]|tara:strand:- start:638 stop:898 length:261 start_codon:yes stop_codon:yes gene_type:complete
MPQLQGDLKFATVTALLEHADALAAGPLDLGKVGATDSAGVAFLLALCRRAAAQGRQLPLLNAAPQVRTLLTFYGVDTMFELEARP